VLDVGGDDRVVVVDLRVVHDPGKRKLIQAHDVRRSLAVILDVLERRGDDLQLRDHVAGEVARGRPRVGDCLLVLVQGLRRGQGAARGEAEAPVGISLQRGQVVEERSPLALFLALHLCDRARPAGDLCGDLVGTLERIEDSRLVAFEPEALVLREKGSVDEAVRLGNEGLDLALALDDHRQCRGLDASERDDASDPRAAANGGGAGRIHADQPVGLGA
jgi:hypothetical protein